MDSSNALQNERTIQQLSESANWILCKAFGTPHQVAMRRDMLDVWNLVKTSYRGSDTQKCHFSGSFAEGFRLNSSDIDVMRWPNNHRVIWDKSQTQYYDTKRYMLMLADSSDSLPGFSLLWLPIPRTSTTVRSAVFKMNGRYYISSSKFLEKSISSLLFHSTIHGPCRLRVVDGRECDIAFCFSCDFWPPSAYPWIDRCHSWPERHVVNDIVKNGCHFVAKGHKLGNHEDSEWMISFSLAEKKLVHSMNHSQFLSYGFLKLFLKEVINHEVNEADTLLCSYHMKTVIFWVIQKTEMSQWRPQNILQCLWVCFKSILKCVYEGVCPNFFIPENNMFLSKIHGHSQAILFWKLYPFYEKGISCLFQSPFLSFYSRDILCDIFSISKCIDVYSQISEADFDTEMFAVISVHDLPNTQLYSHIVDLHQITRLKDVSLTKYQVPMLQYFTTVILQRLTFLLFNNRIGSNLNNVTFRNAKNKDIYFSSKMTCHMLKLVIKFGCMSDTLYLAMHFYQTCRFREALSITKMTKIKLGQPHLINFFKVDSERYKRAVGGRSWSTKLRQAVVDYIVLDNEVVYIGELVTEQKSALQNGMKMSFIPPMVLILLLEFQCYRHVDIANAQIALNDLLVLVNFDQETHIPRRVRDISWQILGICQQITGDLQAALYSYEQSLRQYREHHIQNATKKRIKSIKLSSRHAISAPL